MKQFYSIITMLLIVTIMATVSGQSDCNSKGPIPSGACKDDYVNCVTNVITVLRDRTPYSERTVSYYPGDRPRGGVVGQASCVDGCSFADCRSCVFAAKEWFDQKCPYSSAATYSAANCIMSYSQILV
ncbi:hypothetical protein LINPERPRIM_LOCUS23455 [Linum perenne]